MTATTEKPKYKNHTEILAIIDRIKNTVATWPGWRGPIRPFVTPFDGTLETEKLSSPDDLEPLLELGKFLCSEKFEFFISGDASLLSIRLAWYLSTYEAGWTGPNGTNELEFTLGMTVSRMDFRNLFSELKIDYLSILAKKVEDSSNDFRKGLEAALKRRQQ